MTNIHNACVYFHIPLLTTATFALMAIIGKVACYLF